MYGVMVKVKKPKSLHLKDQKSFTKYNSISCKIFVWGLIFAESALQSFW